jgi:hypothetical protein
VALPAEREIKREEGCELDLCVREREGAHGLKLCCTGHVAMKLLRSHVCT